ncbi:MAG TPA: hypothetical protein VMZ91_10535 [Candidatus Paceibacterota bacterium]|nr:hypothetical protein [Candidatus Paceibacterota bacterium]
MAYYEDLSPYNYRAHSKRELNIGWLQKDKEFNTGEVSKEFLEKLRVYNDSKFSIHNTRGFHICEFCKEQISDDKIKAELSSCEIRVVGSDNKVYASPKMLIHYIESHKYLPPQEFIDAVMNGPIPGSNEYGDTIKRLPESWEQRAPDPNDEDYDKKIIDLMVNGIAEDIDKKILNDLLDKSPDFKKFMESYGKVMPSVYNMTNKNKKSE